MNPAQAAPSPPANAPAGAGAAVRPASERVGWLARRLLLLLVGVALVSLTGAGAMLWFVS